MYIEHNQKIVESINLGSISQIQESIEATCRDCEVLEGKMAYNIERTKYLALILFLKEQYDIDHFEPLAKDHTRGRECLLFG